MLQSVLGNADRFVVVDVETTGLYDADRVVEVTTVTVDGRGEIVDEWDTLVDPQRDVGPTHIHGVTASMVSAAPRFGEIAATLGGPPVRGGAGGPQPQLRCPDVRQRVRAAGRAVRAGLGRVHPPRGRRQARGRVPAARGGAHPPHRALGDARATARLLACAVRGRIGRCSAAHVFDVSVPYSSRTLQREMVHAREVPLPYLARLASRIHHRGARGAVLAYLDLLDRALADLVITDREQARLQELAADLGLDHREVAHAHRRYLDELIAAARRDEIVTDGMAVCFTGTATYPDGTRLPRRKLETIAADLGLELTGSVTKSGCDLLVAADPASQSGKAGKARRYGIPIVDVHDLLVAQPSGRIPAVSAN